MTMLRSFAPFLLVGFVVVLAGTLVYDAGAAAWVLYLIVAVALVIVLVGYARWEEREHSARRR